MVKKEIIRKLKLFRKALEKDGIRVEKIVLYGSQISGKAHRDSDIDVAVVSPDFGKKGFDGKAQLWHIASKIDLRIEPYAVSSKSYENDLWVPLIYEIRDKGVEIETAK